MDTIYFSGILMISNIHNIWKKTDYLFDVQVVSFYYYAIIQFLLFLLLITIIYTSLTYFFSSA